MSVTELQVIHRHVAGTAVASQEMKEGGVSGATSARRFLLPQQNDFDQDDTGLVMKIDNKLTPGSSGKTIMRVAPTSTATTTTTASSPSAVRPSAVSSQLCGQGHEVTGWVLRGALFLQTAHIPFIKLTHKLSDAVQRKAKLLMPLVFYTSLLVLVAQVGAVVTLFAQAFMPLGMWFLLACIAILGAMFCYTALFGNPHQSQHLHQKTPPLSPAKQL